MARPSGREAHRPPLHDATQLLTALLPVDDLRRQPERVDPQQLLLRRDVAHERRCAVPSHEPDSLGDLSDQARGVAHVVRMELGRGRRHAVEPAAEVRERGGRHPQGCGDGPTPSTDSGQARRPWDTRQISWATSTSSPRSTRTRPNTSRRSASRAGSTGRTGRTPCRATRWPNSTIELDRRRRHLQPGGGRSAAAVVPVGAVPGRLLPGLQRPREVLRTHRLDALPHPTLPQARVRQRRRAGCRRSSTSRSTIASTGWWSAVVGTPRSCSRSR